MNTKLTHLPTAEGKIPLVSLCDRIVTLTLELLQVQGPATRAKLEQVVNLWEAADRLDMRNRVDAAWRRTATYQNDGREDFLIVLNKLRSQHHKPLAGRIKLPR